MDMKTIPRADAAELVLPAADFDATLKFFTERLGFRLDAIFPADDPATALVSGHGVRLRLERRGTGAGGTLRLLARDPAALARAFGGGAAAVTAPNGTRIEFAAEDPPYALPPERPSFVVAKMGGGAGWGVGRAGMLYRDLIPDRQNGRFIASHIRIPDGGPVPDYVHFHKIRFQMIYCYRGWVRLVYEDQGPPFVMQAGDCVLQPPEIRHRVLECSPGLEVIEIGCPAEHMTCVDHAMPLPNGTPNRARVFGGQQFVHHMAAKAEWKPWRLAGFAARDIGIGEATDGLAGVKVARVSGTPAGEAVRHGGEFLFLFVLEGSVTLAADGHGSQRLDTGDAVTVPRGLAHRLSDCSADLELLEVSLPAALPV
ncbi:MAG: cupin domain-containing protein [Candidatus Odyssella sp.]|nr:cupin domain-containing protein [Candidatus Odyssella sp.]